MLATFAQSPIAFNAWATLLGSLNQALDVKTRDSIGLAVSEEWLQLLPDGPQLYGRAYGQAAGRRHHFRSEGACQRPEAGRRRPVCQFARKVIETRGNVSEADLKAVRDAGYTDANVMEIVALVAMYSLTNFFNNVFDPENDFPAVKRAGSI